jgi:hypothetical protein
VFEVDGIEVWIITGEIKEDAASRDEKFLLSLQSGLLTVD